MLIVNKDNDSDGTSCGIKGHWSMVTCSNAPRQVIVYKARGALWWSLFLQVYIHATRTCILKVFTIVYTSHPKKTVFQTRLMTSLVNVFDMSMSSTDLSNTDFVILFKRKI